MKKEMKSNRSISGSNRHTTGSGNYYYSFRQPFPAEEAYTTKKKNK